MSKVGNFIIEVQEFVWDFFDEDGNFVADDLVKTKDDLMTVIKTKFGTMGVDVAKDEIFAIETGDHFSDGHQFLVKKDLTLLLKHGKVIRKVRKGVVMTQKVKYVVYTQNNKMGKTAEFDNAKDAVKWAKENVYAFDYVKEKKDDWEDLFFELLEGIGKGECKYVT